MSDLPPELIVKPTALIGLLGLDITDSIHHSVWDAFNNRRTEGAAVQYKLFGDSHEFPTVKPKRNTYEWYIPKGILKRNWMNKYLNDIPAVAVLFYNLDWHDATWNDKKINCVSRVQSLRASLEGRNTKIALVLIQKETSSAPGSEDSVATEKASALCAACELSIKSLYFLPYVANLQAYMLRLEQCFYDLAQKFYHEEYKNVKSHKEHLSKASHQYLFVRHQFKMAFFNELRQDQNMAYKHYQQAYSNLLEVRMLDTNCLEIKTIASFVNYKLCKLMFSLNLPKDAISQFRSHIERFKNRSGSKELIYEHHAWMSNQYSNFADLFVEAIRQGLPAVQTQHPGYYFQIAANYASQRQVACKELCNDCLAYPDPDPLAGSDKLEFFGQRPWRPGKLNAEPADMTREVAAIKALQFKEKSVNHSQIIIGLLGNAVSQFKVYRCPRMRRQLVVQMAEEYFHCEDYGKVLTLLMHMLWEYRTEYWPVLLTDILRNALNAAYLSANAQDYLTLALEALGPSSTCSQERKTAIYRNITRILQRQSPYPEPDLPQHLNMPAIAEKWATQLNRKEPFFFTIDDENMILFIGVKARFTKPSYVARSRACIEIFIRNQYHSNIEYSKISVTVTNSGYTSEYPVTSTDQHFSLSAKEIKRFECNFEVSEPREIPEIQITAISVHLGNHSGTCILKFTASGRESNVIDRMYPEIQQLRKDAFDSIRPLSVARVEQEESRVELSVEAKSPALLGEWFPIKLALSTNEAINNVLLTVNTSGDIGSSDQLTDFSLNSIDKHSSISVEVKRIEANSTSDQTIFIRAHNINDRNFNIKAEYVRSNSKKESKDLTYSLTVVKAFEVTTQFFTMLCEPLSKSFIDEPLFLMPHITCTSPWPIEIDETFVELSPAIVKETGNSPENLLRGTILSNGETATDVYCIVPKSSSEQPTSTGILNIKWKRANDNRASVASSSVTLTPLRVEDALININTKMPPHGWVRTPLCISYFIKNHSDFLITLKLNMEASDAFMFAGHKQIDISILPDSEKKIEWILRPMVPGFVALPSLSLSVSSEEEQRLSKVRLAEVVERSIPSHIYILPKSQWVAD